MAMHEIVKMVKHEADNTKRGNLRSKMAKHEAVKMASRVRTHEKVKKAMHEAAKTEKFSTRLEGCH